MTTTHLCWQVEQVNLLSLLPRHLGLFLRLRSLPLGLLLHPIIVYLLLFCLPSLLFSLNLRFSSGSVFLCLNLPSALLLLLLVQLEVVGLRRRSLPSTLR